MEGLDVLVGAVGGLGGEVVVEGDRVLLVFGRRGFSLVDLPLEALRVLLGFSVVVIVERGFGEGGVDYYYYVGREEVGRLVGWLESGVLGKS